MTFKSKKDLTDWAIDQFNKYGIRQPETYTEQELIDLNPAVPVDFIKRHVRDRDESL
jgi:hypothetical protein